MTDHLNDDARERIREATQRMRLKHGLPEEPAQILAPAQTPPERPPVKIVAHREPGPIEVPTIQRPWPVTSGPATFEEISPPLRQAMKEAFAAQRWPILIYGPPGTGKTCAAAVAYRGCRQSAVWFECGELLSDVAACRSSPEGIIPKASHNGRSVEISEFSIKRKIGDAGLVVLNDIGLRSPSPAAYEILLGIIDMRLRRPLIVTSNLDPDQLEQVFDARIVSRLARGSVIQVVGPDRRAVGASFVRVKGAALAPTD